jgi:hypothetical protein
MAGALLAPQGQVQAQVRARPGPRRAALAPSGEPGTRGVDAGREAGREAGFPRHRGPRGRGRPDRKAALPLRRDHRLERRDQPQGETESGAPRRALRREGLRLRGGFPRGPSCLGSCTQGDSCVLLPIRAPGDEAPLRRRPVVLHERDAVDRLGRCPADPPVGEEPPHRAPVPRRPSFPHHLAARGLAGRLPRHEPLRIRNLPLE